MRVSYAAGTTADVTQNVDTDPHYEWQTGSVVSESGTAVTYRYGWGPLLTFTDGMELLPIATKFALDDGTAETTYTVVSGITTLIH